MALAENKNDASKGSPGNEPRLRIAQIAPLYERVPPKLYGGTERVVYNITEEMVRRGHEVTLFASGDSITSAKLVAGYPESLRLAGIPEHGMFLHFPMISDAFEGSDKYDIIHSHIDYWTFPFSALSPVPSVTTMHGRLDIDALVPVYSRYRKQPLVSISNAQRKPLRYVNWIDTVYHGLPRDLLKFNPKGGQYLAFLGRISPEKRPDIAIDVARKVGIPFKIAAKVDVVDRAYYEAVIKPRLSPPDVEYIGEINEQEKSEFLGNALALLFTIDWPEPFGLAMIESMACGTPVITRPCGSVPEIINPGVSGIIGDTVEDLVAAVKAVDKIDRAGCRREFENRFTAEIMGAGYERVYRKLIAEKAAAKKK